MKTKNSNIIMQNKVIVWIVLATGLILLIPLIVMQFYDDMAWGLGDFISAGALLFGTGLVFVLVARKVRNPMHRAAIGLVLAAAFFLVWIELAVGIID